MAQMRQHVRDDAIRLVLTNCPGADFDITAVESYRLLEKVAMGSRRQNLDPVDGYLHRGLAWRGGKPAIRICVEVDGALIPVAGASEFTAMERVTVSIDGSLGPFSTA